MSTRQHPPSAADAAGDRVQALRDWLRANRLAGFIVPHADEYQSEFIPACAERLRWLSGFSGSAGTAVILAKRAALFVDGRYTVQAAAEVDPGVFEIHHSIAQPLGPWLAAHLPPRGRLGYDPWLHSERQVTALEEACARAGGRAAAVAANPLDALWTDRPPAPLAAIDVVSDAEAGLGTLDKRTHIATTLRHAGEDAAILNAPDSIAWLLNIRGGDVSYTPVALAFAILHADGAVELFVDPRKLTPAVERHLGAAVTIDRPEALAAALDRFGASRKTVRFDPDGTPFWIVRRLRQAGARLAAGADPCALPKAIKNAVEQAGIRSAHVRDGAALTRFLAWLDGAAAGEGLNEVTAAERLARFRAADSRYRGPSFPTISAAGPHGAIVHYRPTAATNRRLEPGTLYLVDSGGQYRDGTTDVTRTVAIGTPSADMRRHFTLVLKGHIALATVRFPKGTTGAQLDALARHALWQHGLDYDHGTGHGVGCYLGVHEGPQRISKLPNTVALAAGMVVSNEPGYYRRDGYGIRIENLVLVQPVAAPAGAEHELLGFETLTLAPIDRTLIDASLLSAADLAWVDAYHARVAAVLTPLLDAATVDWLRAATRPLAL
ncbi:MAG: aminopeptidase P family protein [Defluviicoccus sp.]